MLPNFLVPESVVREDGKGLVLSLDTSHGSLLLLTLGITRILEQESLDISIHGSAEGNEWSAKPLVAFSQKFYCGTYQMVLDLSKHPDTRFLRAQWKVNRWGRGEAKPLFGFYLFAQLAKEHVAAKTA
jgi:hypothetical protein